MISSDVLNYILAACAVVALLVFLWANRSDKYPDFKLIHLVCARNGKPDGAKMQEIVVFALMSWAFVVFVNERKLPEWFVTIFVGAFVLRSAYSAWLRTKGDKEERDDEFRNKRLPAVPPPRDRE